MPLTVTITSSVGTYQVPGTLPIGGGGSTTTGRKPGLQHSGQQPEGTSSTFSRRRLTVLDVNAKVTITHTYDADLRATLTGPDGTSVLLFGGVGGSANDFTNTTLDDEAATAIGAGAAPFTGSYKPVNPLSAFDGQLIAGTWKLTIVDTAEGHRDAELLVCRPAGRELYARGERKHADFNGDGYADLAIGVPDEDVGAVADAGAVHVLYGSAAGLVAAGNQFWTQDTGGSSTAIEAGDRFGSALATGDFNGDGFADLAVGVPDEDVGAVADAGVGARALRVAGRADVGGQPAVDAELRRDPRQRRGGRPLRRRAGDGRLGNGVRGRSGGRRARRGRRRRGGRRRR